jgi:pSer/pThr/pTyr-binding forkhead associated (FHA) protein
VSSVRLFLQKTSNGSQVTLAGVLSIGRSSESALKLTEGRPSRNHARITVRDGSAWVEDLGSTNGTYVNGARIAAPVRLNPGDQVRFDMEEFLFQTDPPPDADRTAAREPAPPPAPPQSPPPPPPEPKPEVKAVVAESARSNLPPVWTIDGGGSGGNKTVFKSIEEMEAERQAARAVIPDMSSAGAPDVPELVVMGSGAPVVFQLRGSGNQQEWIVGSDPGHEIRIERSGVSGLHAKIVNAGKLWKVVDQVSQNGTFVNGKRSMTSYLRSGDRIAFGSVECLFRLPHDGAGASARATQTSRRPEGRRGIPRSAKILIVAALSFLATVALLVALLAWLE